MFKGRIGVGQYWAAIAALIVLVLLVNVALIAVAIPAFGFAIKSMASPENALGMLLVAAVVGGLIGALPSLVALPFIIGLQARRYHDIGITGWTWVALAVVGIAAGVFFPIFAGPVVPGSHVLPAISPMGVGVTAVLGIASLVLICWPGTKGPNAYGEPFRYRSVWAAILGSTKPAIEGKKPFSIFTLVAVLILVVVAALGTLFLMKPHPAPSATPTLPGGAELPAIPVHQGPASSGLPAPASSHSLVSGTNADIQAAMAKVQSSAKAYFAAKGGYGSSEDSISDCFSQGTVFGSGQSGADVMSVMKLTGGGVCKTDGKAYVMSVPTPDGLFACIDSTGTSCQVKDFARGTACGACVK